MFTTTVVLCMLAVAQIHAQGILDGVPGLDLTMVPGIAMGANGLDVAAGALRGRLALAPSSLPSLFFFVLARKKQKKQSKKKAKQKKKRKRGC